VGEWKREGVRGSERGSEGEREWQREKERMSAPTEVLILIITLIEIYL
jgi:hypothetical protein